MAIAPSAILAEHETETIRHLILITRGAHGFAFLFGIEARLVRYLA